MNIPDTQQTLALMRKHHIDTITVSFSGGNDEGQVESVHVDMDEGHDPVEIPTGWYGWTYRPPNASWQDPYRLQPNTPELVQIAAGVEQPINQEYGSFAGDFYVSGDLIWNAEEGTCVMEHDYETPRSEHLTTEF